MNHRVRAAGWAAAKWCGEACVGLVPLLAYLVTHRYGALPVSDFNGSFGVNADCDADAAFSLVISMGHSALAPIVATRRQTKTLPTPVFEPPAR
jgi:hypothetical protein